MIFRLITFATFSPLYLTYTMYLQQNSFISASSISQCKSYTPIFIVNDWRRLLDNSYSIFSRDKNHWNSMWHEKFYKPSLRMFYYWVCLCVLNIFRKNNLPMTLGCVCLSWYTYKYNYIFKFDYLRRNYVQCQNS